MCAFQTKMVVSASSGISGGSPIEGRRVEGADAQVLRDEAVVQLNSNNVKVLRRELEASEDRFRVGEVTRTDVAQAEARLARSISDLEAAEGELISSRATYTRVIGNVPTNLQPPPPLPLKRNPWTATTWTR